LISPISSTAYDYGLYIEVLGLLEGGFVIVAEGNLYS